MMHQPLVIHVLILLYFYALTTGSLATSHQDRKVLKVGEELWKETLPLQMGSALYELRGLEPFKWYEVKISYPASIPASFSLQLRRDASDLGLQMRRRLLNTEKLIFQYDNLINEGSIYVLVTVMPEGVVAIPNVKEREFIIFNIVCDELLLGIPHKAWWVGALVLLCIALAAIVPRYLPPFLLQSNVAATQLQASKRS
uniref:Uncharacterized protein n=1 Tax=Kalanchoe fedtschenkoi TaxID=63787 RepID=A0A7N0T5M5_KALFE